MRNCNVKKVGWIILRKALADLLFLELACSDALMSLATKLANLHKVEVSSSEKKTKKETCTPVQKCKRLTSQPETLRKVGVSRSETFV